MATTKKKRYKIHENYGVLDIEGAELFRQGFLMIQGAAYQEFTDRKTSIPKRVRLDWNDDRESFIVSFADEELDSLAFTDESNQMSNPKPRARIRIKTAFKAVGIPWPEDIIAHSSLRIPYQVTKGKLELFLGEAYQQEGLRLTIPENPMPLRVSPQPR